MLAPWKKNYDQPRQRSKEKRHHSAHKGLSSQSYGFSSIHIWISQLDYKESWVPKNLYLWTMVLEKTLESPLDCKEIQTFRLKEMNLEYSLEGLMLKLKFQYFGHVIWRTDSFEKTLLLGKINDRRRRRWQRMRWLDGSMTQWTWVWVNSGSWWWTGRPVVLQSVGLQRVRYDWATELNLKI